MIPPALQIKHSNAVEAGLGLDVRDVGSIKTTQFPPNKLMLAIHHAANTGR
jgi:hypothetical protein